MKNAFKGFNYVYTVNDVNNIYDAHVHSGLSNREIWKRYIWPIYHISERTFYNYLKVSADPDFINKCKEMNNIIQSL